MNIELVLVYRRDDDGLDYIRELLGEVEENNEDVDCFVQYNLTSSKFLEKRTANSLLSRHATLNTPLILFRKEGVVVRALYSEEVIDISYYDQMIIRKLVEARQAIPVIVEEEELEYS